jgi:LPPG:FO 2-phospho-L-lactate transferase
VAITANMERRAQDQVGTSIVALAGGVGGAKLAQGLDRVLSPGQLAIVVNTGDDEVFHGLHVSPDLDTVMYTLAGLANVETGWGVAGDTFKALEMLKQYEAPSTWFNLGDKDLATHIERTRLLRQGWSLSKVTAHLCRQLRIKAAVFPMSNEPVRTVVETDIGCLPFQEYFVKHRCQPTVRGICFEGAEKALMSLELELALRKATSVIVCPSNPIVSIGPILSVPGVRDRLKAFNGIRLAVSPIVADEALRGPAAKMLQELGEEVSCVGVARRLREVCDVFVIDSLDARRRRDIQALGIDAVVLDTIMNSDKDKVRLARELLQIVDERQKR